MIQRSHHLPPRTIYDWRHYLAVLQRKPGALRNGAPFADLPLLSPAERRQVLEEAAGISRYKARKAECLRRLERVGANLDRLHDILGEDASVRLIVGTINLVEKIAQLAQIPMADVSKLADNNSDARAPVDT